jgi:diketogulonate reductase-like aldo/keto reductase
MERRRFGSLEVQVPVMGQGTWELEGGDGASAVAALRKGLDLGMTHVDTAEMYGSGAAEEIVAEAIAGRREQVFLVSKVLPGNASRRGTVRACEQSLSRLRTDHLDCYLLHWPGPHPLEDTVAGFEDLARGGKIRSWGVSNFDVADLEEVHRVRGAHGPVCNQVLYHLAERAIEHRVLPWCEKHGLAVVGYSPFGHGHFPSPRSRQGQVLQQIADAHQATVRQVALAFLVRRPPLFTIPKASSAAHAADNAGAGALRLSGTELGRLEDTFALRASSDDLPML